MTIKYNDPYGNREYAQLKGDKSDAFFKIVFDEATLHKTDAVSGTWRELYDDSKLLSYNLLDILHRIVYLPYDFYDIIAVYFLLPSALCKNIPYLFLCGASGSGKSTIAKLGANLHGIKISSSSDSYAGIRNDLDKRRRAIIERVDPEDPSVTLRTYGEANTCMVWDDIDPGVFTTYPDLYRLFKFGSNRASSVITISSSEVGQNLEFSTFCPKTFSSISPLHLDDRFRELRRRLIVIPCKRIEDLSDERKIELEITNDNWQSNLIDIDSYDWKDFSKEFKTFWDIPTAKGFVDARKILSKSVRGLTSLQRTISLDLMACGIASGIWENEDIALDRMKFYWQWFKQETEKNAGLGGLLKDYIRQAENNAKASGTPVTIHSHQLRNQINNWVATGWLFETPRTSQIKSLMYDLGMRLQQGIWRKN